MVSTTRHLRVVQGACILLILVCIAVVNLLGRKSRSTSSFIEYIIILAAIWSAVSGFSMQRRILRATIRPMNVPRKSTPLSRWRAGHLVRLWSASAVALWGLVLGEFAGTVLLANLFFATGLLLLVAWRPTSAPSETEG
jgi:hypothetical protein